MFQTTDLFLLYLNFQENVIGDRCDRCKANAFYLSDRYELGCVECFCMGVSRSCQSTSWNRAQVKFGDCSGCGLYFNPLYTENP